MTLIAYGVGAGVVIHALFGLSLAAADKARAVIVFLLFGIQVAFLIYLLRSGTLRELQRAFYASAGCARHGSFQQFVVIGIALNSLLLLGAIAFCAHSCTRDVLLAGVAVIASNPYVLAQTIFTWPKAFAVFFILLGWNSLRMRHSPVIVALCAALAFHSHPFAIVFVLCFGLIYLVGSLPVKRFHAAAIYAGTVSLVILRWFIWTRFLGLPAGLLAQNFGTMHDAWSAPFRFLSIRFLNLASTLSPWRGQTLSVSAIADQSLTSLPGAVGAILIMPALIELCRSGEGRRLRTVGMFLPGLLLIGVFSNPALPVLHGFQPLVVPLVFFALSYLHRIASRSAFIALAGIQIACNCALVWAQMFLVGARFP